MIRSGPGHEMERDPDPKCNIYIPSPTPSMLDTPSNARSECVPTPIRQIGVRGQELLIPEGQRETVNISSVHTAPQIDLRQPSSNQLEVLS
jgi:hypothetical protein